MSGSSSSIPPHIFCKVKVSKGTTLHTDTINYQMRDSSSTIYGYAGLSNDLYITGSISNDKLSIRASSNGFTKYGGSNGRPAGSPTGKYLNVTFFINNDYYYTNSITFGSSSFTYTAYDIIFTPVEYFTGDSETAYSNKVDSNNYAYAKVFTLPTI